MPVPPKADVRPSADARTLQPTRSAISGATQIEWRRFWFLILLLGTLPGCIRFDDYPLGELCEDARRDNQGRAIDYPEWRICMGGGGASGDGERDHNLGGELHDG